jgi:hypothetical protein
LIYGNGAGEGKRVKVIFSQILIFGRALFLELPQASSNFIPGNTIL